MEYVAGLVLRSRPHRTVPTSSMKLRTNLTSWALVLGLVSCVGPLRKDKLAITDVQLRTKLLEYTDNFSSIIERVTNSIASRSDDPALRRKTVEWKLRTIPLCRKIALDKEPHEAFLDLWTMTLQIEAFAAGGDGSSHFEGYQEELSVAAAEAVDGIEAIARSVFDGKGFERARAEVERYAEENPITGSFVRQSQLPSNTDAFTIDAFGWMGSLPVIGAFDGLDKGAQAVHEVARVAERFSRVTEALPQELRWQIDLLLYDLEARPTTAELRRSLAETSQAARSLSETAARLPADLQATVESTLAQLDTQSEGVRGTLREVDSVLERSEVVVASIERTAESLVEASAALEAMAVAFTGPPEPQPEAGAPPGRSEEVEAEGEPFDIEAYGRAIDGVATGASELRALVDELRGAAGSREVDTLLSDTELRLEALVDRITRGGLLLVGAVLLAALSYRLILLRFRRHVS